MRSIAGRKAGESIKIETYLYRFRIHAKGRAGKCGMTICLGLLFILLDQASKLIVEWLGIPFSYNQGISFGWLAFSGWLVINFVIIFFLSIIFFEKPNLAFLLILSAGVSNLLDRIIRGGVVDFIHLPFFPWSFNLADVGITAGVILLLKDIMQSVISNT
jgi:signal peptidase II